MELADPTFGYDRTFYDRLGRSVCVPRTSNNAKFFDDGYTKAPWDYRTSNMLIGEGNETLYVRDVDESGENLFWVIYGGGGNGKGILLGSLRQTSP